MSYARAMDEVRSRVTSLVDLGLFCIVVAAAMPCALLLWPSEATSELIYAGRVILTGGVPYLDVVSTDGPFALAIGALASVAGGAGALTLLLGLATIAAATALHRELSIAFDRGSSLVAIVLGLSAAFTFAPDGGREFMALPLHMIALTGLLHFIRTQSVSGLIAVGVVLGAAPLIALDRAFVPALLAGASIAVAARWGAWRAAAVIAAAGAAIVLPFAALIWSLSAFGEMIGQYGLSALPALGLDEMSRRIPASLGDFLLGSWICPIALAGCGVASLQIRQNGREGTPAFADPFHGAGDAWRREGEGILVPLLLIGFAIDLTGFLVTNDHGGALPRFVPLMIWFAAIALHAVDTPVASWHAAPTSPIRRAAGLVLILVSIAATVQPLTRPPTPSAIARAEGMLARQLAPGDRVHVLGASSALYNDLGVFSPSSDFAATTLHPSLNAGRGERLLAQLQLRPPTFIVEREREPEPLTALARTPDFGPAKLWLANRYRKIVEFTVDGDTMRIHRLCAGPC